MMTMLLMLMMMDGSGVVTDQHDAVKRMRIDGDETGLLTHNNGTRLLTTRKQNTLHTCTQINTHTHTSLGYLVVIVEIERMWLQEVRHLLQALAQ